MPSNADLLYLKLTREKRLKSMREYYHAVQKTKDMEKRAKRKQPESIFTY